MKKRVSRSRAARIAKSKQVIAQSSGVTEEEVFVAPMSSEDELFDIPRISCGSLAADEATGGGAPLGRTMLLWGKESGGKSFTAQKIAASAQCTCTRCKTPIEHQAILPPKGSNKQQVQEHKDGVIACAACGCLYHKDLAPPQRYADVPGVEKEDMQDLPKDIRFCAACGTLEMIGDYEPRPKVDDYELATLGPYRCECGASEPMLVSWFDFERTFQPDWATDCGLDVDSLQYIRPQYGESGLDAMLQLVKDGASDVFVLDSIAGVTSFKEMENSLHSAHMAMTARLMAQFLRKWDLACSQCSRDHNIDPTLILINQVRTNIGQMMGNPDTLFGGKSQRFHSSIIIKFTGSKTDVDQRKVGADSRKEYLGRVSKTMCSLQVEKNKTASKQRYSATFTIASIDQGSLTKGDVIDQEYIWSILRKTEMLKEHGTGKSKAYFLPGWPSIQNKGVGYEQADFMFKSKAQFMSMLCDSEGFTRFMRQYIPRYSAVHWSDVQENLTRVQFKKPAGL